MISLGKFIISSLVSTSFSLVSVSTSLRGQLVGGKSDNKANSMQWPRGTHDKRIRGYIGHKIG